MPDSKKCLNLTACLEELKTDDYLGLQMPEMHSMVQNFSLNNRYFLCFPAEPVPLYFYLAMAVNHNYRLLPRIKPIVQHLIESGLIHKIISDNRPKRLNVVLDVSTLVGGSLGVLLTGYFCAIFLFVCEVSVICLQKRFKSNMFLYYCYHFVDGFGFYLQLFARRMHKYFGTSAVS